MGFLDNTLQVRVNQYDEQYVCNAFWNGSSLTGERRGGGTSETVSW